MRASRSTRRATRGRAARDGGLPDAAALGPAACHAEARDVARRRIALARGASRWITGAAARAHAHLERARHEVILVGRGTLEADAPRLDVRLAGLEDRAAAPRRCCRRGRARPAGWETAGRSPPRPISRRSTTSIICSSRAAPATAAAFLAADLVDRLLLYRAPILIGGGRDARRYRADRLDDAHGRWRLPDTRQLGSDRLEVYERVRAESGRRHVHGHHHRYRHDRARRAARRPARRRSRTGYDTATIDLGASIACSGVCLTVVDKGPGWFAVDISGETVSRTAAGPMGRRAAASISNARSRSATNWAAISSPAMSTASARSSRVTDEGDSHRVDDRRAARSRPISRPRARSRSTASR